MSANTDRITNLKKAALVALAVDFKMFPLPERNAKAVSDSRGIAGP